MKETRFVLRDSKGLPCRCSEISAVVVHFFEDAFHVLFLDLDGCYAVLCGGHGMVCGIPERIPMSTIVNIIWEQIGLNVYLLLRH